MRNVENVECGKCRVFLSCIPSLSLQLTVPSYDDDNNHFIVKIKLIN